LPSALREAELKAWQDHTRSWKSHTPSRGRGQTAQFPSSSVDDVGCRSPVAVGRGGWLHEQTNRTIRAKLQTRSGPPDRRPNRKSRRQDNELTQTQAQTAGTGTLGEKGPREPHTPCRWGFGIAGLRITGGK